VDWIQEERVLEVGPNEQCEVKFPDGGVSVNLTNSLSLKTERQSMKQRFRLYRRRHGGRFYVRDNITGKQVSLKTTDRTEA